MDANSRPNRGESESSSPALKPAEMLAVGFESDPGGSPGDEPGSDYEIENLAAEFPQLELLEILGRGGMGIVYKARQRTLDRLVAVKVISDRFRKHPHFTERFQREARAMARLNHPNIVTIHEFGETEKGRPYLVMEFIEGASLRGILSAGRVKPAEALAIVPKICDALAYAHEEGVVHRDIKPENVLLDLKGRVKIADFGLAKLLDNDAAVGGSSARQPVGTPHYMAPEQIERPQAVDQRADIFALGVLFYEMLTGELPLGRFAAPSKRVEVDVRLDEVVLRALERDPEMRFQSAAEFRSSLETASTPAATPSKEQRSQFPMKTAAIVAAALLCVAFAAIGIYKNRESAIDGSASASGPAKQPAAATNLRYHFLTLPGNATMRLVWIPGGSFAMGASNGESDELPLRTVTVDGFWMGETEVTQAQWRAVVGSDPVALAFPGLPKNPVERISFEEIVNEFLPAASKQSGVELRLPTEAEWEFACRAGSTGTYHFGQGEGHLNDHGWSVINSSMRTHPVGEKRPNAWGLYDMHGSVWEWVSDWYGPYDPAETINPRGPATGSGHVVRGGSWHSAARFCRSASRRSVKPDSTSYNFGFRVVATSVD